MTRHPEDPLVGAGREAEPVDGPLEELAGPVRQTRVPFQGPARERRVRQAGIAGSPELPSSCRHDPGADRRGGFAVASRGEVRRRRGPAPRREGRSGRGAGPRSSGGSGRCRVRSSGRRGAGRRGSRRDTGSSRPSGGSGPGSVRRPRGPRHRDDAVLERLAQGLERVAPELRAARRGRGHRSGPERARRASGRRRRRRGRRPKRRGAASGTGGAGGVPIRRGADRRRSRSGSTSSASSRRERRQEAGKPPGEHRLAGAGRTGHQDVVAAGGGDLEGAARERLSADVGEVVLGLGSGGVGDGR